MKKTRFYIMLIATLLSNIAFANCQNPPNLKESIASQYDEIEQKYCQEQSEFWRVKRDNKVGLIDKNNNIIIPFYYDYIGRLQESSTYLKIANNDIHAKFLKARWGIIDITGKEIISPQYDYIYPISDNLFAIEKHNNNFGSSDKTLSKRFNLSEIDGIIGFLDLVQTLNVRSIDKDTKIGLIDINNNVLLPTEYDSVKEFDNQFITIHKNDKSLLIDKQGEILKIQE